MNDQRMCKVASSSGNFVKLRSYSKNRINLDVALGLTVYLARRPRKIFSFLPASWVDVGSKIHLPVKTHLDHSDTDLDRLCTLLRSVLSSAEFYSTSLISDIWFQLGMYCTQKVDALCRLCVDPFWVVEENGRRKNGRIIEIVICEINRKWNVSY